MFHSAGSESSARNELGMRGSRRGSFFKPVSGDDENRGEMDTISRGTNFRLIFALSTGVLLPRLPPHRPGWLNMGRGSRPPHGLLS